MPSLSPPLKTFPFCPMCGSSVSTPVSVPFQSTCTSCGYTYYENLRTSVGALIISGHLVLLVDRAHPPRQNTWDVPGGFTQPNEHPQQTLVREVKEELGVSCQIIKLFGVYAPNPYPYLGKINYTCDLMYLVKPLHHHFIPSEDVSTCRWFSLNRLPSPNRIAFPSTRQVLNDLKTKKYL